MVVLTTAVILPMIEQAGIDRIWFGIYVVLVVEMAQITPPVGFNLFVLQGTDRPQYPIYCQGGVAVLFLLLLAVVLIVSFPEIATYLPQRMAER